MTGGEIRVEHKPDICDLCGRLSTEPGSHIFAVQGDDDDDDDKEVVCVGPPTAHQLNRMTDILNHYLLELVKQLDRL